MENAAQENELDASIAAEIALPETPAEPEVIEAQPSNENEAEPAPAPENVEEPSEPDAFTKRINKITADKYGEKRRADGLQAELDALRSNQTPAQPTDDKPPQLEDFDFDEAKHHQAVVQHEVRKQLAAGREDTAEFERKQEANKLTQKFNTNVTAYIEEHPDYVESIGNLPIFPAETLNAIMGMENAAQVTHYLTKHPELADQVATLPTFEAAMKLGEIRINLANPKPTTKPSAAPAPVETLTSGSSQAKDVGEMSMAEIMSL